MTKINQHLILNFGSLIYLLKISNVHLKTLFLPKTIFEGLIWWCVCLYFIIMSTKVPKETIEEYFKQNASRAVDVIFS